MPRHAPIKVSSETRERIHYLAALDNATQAPIVEAATDEDSARRVRELEVGSERARQALHGGDTAAIAYVLGEDPDAVARVSGAKPSPAR